MGYTPEWYQKNKLRLRINHKRWAARNPEKLKEYNRVYRQRVKDEVLTHYGSGNYACIRCGFSDKRALSIDHILGGGGQHKDSLRVHLIYIWLKKNGYPEGYQTLCMNCQFIKREEEKEYA